MTGAPVLSFRCTGASADRYAAAPTLLLEVEVTESTGVAVHAGMLRCQIRIEPVRRQYDDDEADGLTDLFGDRGRWGETLKPIQLATVAFWLPQFSGVTTVTVPVPCTYDTEVAASRYLTALSAGEVPLLLLFSGTVFLAGGDGMQVAQVPWDREARYRLPVATWQAVMDVFFPNTGWVRLRRDVLEDLTRYRSRHALPTWEETVTRLLARAAECEGAAGAPAERPTSQNAVRPPVVGAPRGGGLR
ncbi:MAG: DUF6084 family protein [Actinomycetes bacterium]